MSKLSKLLVLAFASTRPTRSLLNRRYNKLDMQARLRFHGDYAKIFRRFRPPIQPGSWEVGFQNRSIRVPLNRNSMWLDWDVATSIVAHDAEVKQAYERLLGSEAPPEIFFDVGANYGTHSILMASQGLQVVAFEPNSACLAYARELAAANDLCVQWEHVAIGEEAGQVELAYPVDATWLGTASGALDGRADLIRETVRMVRIDDYASLVAGKRLLMKIDVEGLESQVLAGARGVLAIPATTVIFEANPDADRSALFDQFRRVGYRVFELKGDLGDNLSESAFLESAHTNFLATAAHR